MKYRDEVRIRAELRISVRSALRLLIKRQLVLWVTIPTEHPVGKTGKATLTINIPPILKRVQK